ncbi:MAG TPA: AEC family transporter [Anaerovoracaceae bacterium]|nr:AEC family transporter [Anaerovoracaceae bacterium]
MITPFFILFGLMATGFVSRKLRWLDSSKNDGIGNIVMNIAFPCLLFISIIEIQVKGKILADFLLMTLLSAASFCLYALLALVFIKFANVPVRLRGTVQLSMLTSNNAFMGIPIVMAFFNKQGIILMVANNLAMAGIVFSYGTLILKRDKAFGDHTVSKESQPVLSFLRQILNPMILAIIIGLFVSITEFYIPDALASLLSVLGSLATPLSMIYIGATLYGSTFSSLIRDPLVFGAATVRLTIFAGITYAILWLLPISLIMKQIFLLIITLPSAAIVPVVSAQYGPGGEEAVKIVVLSTLLSLITTPLGVYIALNFL